MQGCFFHIFTEKGMFSHAKLEREKNSEIVLFSDYSKRLGGKSSKAITCKDNVIVTLEEAMSFLEEFLLRKYMSGYMRSLMGCVWCWGRTSNEAIVLKANISR